ncbi:MAG: BolA family protein [Pseudomonadota bacterium]
MDDILGRIESKLQGAFAPSRLAVEDESHLHAGHGGAAEHKAEFGDTPSHIHITLEAGRLSGLSRLARHRAVMDAISDEVARLHAVRLTLSAPE